jgi:hypothetical protein
MKRLVSRSESQAIARRLNKVKRLGFESTAEFVDELILCIAALARRRSDVRDFVAWLEELAVRTNLYDSTGSVEANDVEIFGNVFVVIWLESAVSHYGGGLRDLTPGASP